MKNFIQKLCEYSEYIINYFFYIYFFAYVVGGLYKKSVIFDYLFILLFGLFLGYRIAKKSK